MARKTRKQLVGKHKENDEQYERERSLRALALALRTLWLTRADDPTLS